MNLDEYKFKLRMAKAGDEIKIDIDCDLKGHPKFDDFEEFEEGLITRIIRPALQSLYYSKKFHKDITEGCEVNCDVCKRKSPVDELSIIEEMIL